MDTTLNSNLILLIPGDRRRTWAGTNFKFQSDSINTEEGEADDEQQDPLNSNLILLIPMAGNIHEQVYECFKFQSDSINTYQKKRKIIKRYTFKFQSDSINTSINREYSVDGYSLNSNLILLILIFYVFIFPVNNL